jgi:hypothetical protein
VPYAAASCRLLPLPGLAAGQRAVDIADLMPDKIHQAPPHPAAQGQAAKYAFKCHRLGEGGRDVVYPVNAIAFHPQLGTFASGGGDGVVNTWDGQNKKRLFQISRWGARLGARLGRRGGQDSCCAIPCSWHGCCCSALD